MKKAITIIVIMMLLSLYSQASSSLHTVDSLKALIANSLDKGDGNELIESFLKDQDFLYAFDRFASRYQARPKDGTFECQGRSFLLWLLYDCGIQIYIYVDTNGLFEKAEVLQTYSGL
jgi:hypothetical protein